MKYLCIALMLFSFIGCATLTESEKAQKEADKAQRAATREEKYYCTPSLIITSFAMCDFRCNQLPQYWWLDKWKVAYFASGNKITWRGLIEACKKKNIKMKEIMPTFHL